MSKYIVANDVDGVIHARVLEEIKLNQNLAFILGKEKNESYFALIFVDLKNNIPIGSRSLKTSNYKKAKAMFDYMKPYCNKVNSMDEAIRISMGEDK